MKLANKTKKNVIKQEYVIAYSGNKAKIGCVWKP